MARKPNYRFERKVRDQRKAEKKAAKQRAKAEAAGEAGNDETEPMQPGSEAVGDDQGTDDGGTEDGGTQSDQAVLGGLRVDGDPKT